MKKALLLGTTGIAVAFAMLAFGLAGNPGTAHAQSASQPAATGSLDKKQVETIVREYLLDNPELLLEMQGALEAKQKEEQRIASLEVIKQSKDEIFNSAFDGIVGNPDGKTTIVEFYDYNCGYCKRAQADMHALTKANPDLRFVLKEFPILGPDSQKAHVVSMAFRKLMPEKYGEFHDKLLGGEGRAGEDNAIKLALELGADEAKLREAMKDPAIGEAFNRTYELANKLQISGTPSYVVGNEVVFGALGQDVLAEKIAAAAACQADSTC
ncbi:MULTISPECIES: DsbA family protein [Aminobacter]|uniref:Protein-disulfide isomerase n=1 Tax=Aminobacter niigataensis TaxID=83265 RepID=A0ABR6KYS6_9HYPH|nr:MULTISPECIES: DsbA family protein [Aminobacter]AWC24297.1 Thiol-disulfide oxidoreductase D [Aminobacter sp. MSH1]MBB4649682.1 protein-disulfide isomerase [Aminobacter niigataensis]CAI2935054.1 Thiol-disulfide oxidoreductase D [Aminobacter niigataensis]